MSGPLLDATIICFGGLTDGTGSPNPTLVTYESDACTSATRYMGAVNLADAGRANLGTTTTIGGGRCPASAVSCSAERGRGTTVDAGKTPTQLGRELNQWPVHEQPGRDCVRGHADVERDGQLRWFQAALTVSASRAIPVLVEKRPDDDPNRRCAIMASYEG